MNIPPNWHLLLNDQDINKICDYVANQLNIKFKDQKVILVGILKGVMPFMTELSYRLTFEHSWQFIEISSYKNSVIASEPKLLTQIDQTHFIGQKIILIDELLDSGETMKFAFNFFKKITKTEVYTCVAFTKNKPSTFDVNFSGLSLPDLWLVGFGLDHKGYFRNLKAIYVVSQKIDPEVAKFVGEISKTLKNILDLSADKSFTSKQVF